MNYEHQCNVCSCDYSDDEGGVQGHFGMLPVSFCPTCFSSMCDMANQYMEIDQEEIELMQEEIQNLRTANQDLKFQLIQKDNLLHKELP
jgi:hypothetical protein